MIYFLRAGSPDDDDDEDNDNDINATRNNRGYKALQP
jgi:hypothetical protein